MPQDKISILINGVDVPTYQIFEMGDYKIAYFCAKNKSLSSPNEDSLFVRSQKNSFVFGVADGAGGHPLGAEASKVISSKLVSVEPSFVFESPVKVFDEVNEAVKALKVGARSTLALCVVEEDHFSSHSVGDSEILYWNAKGDLIYSNIPDSTTGYRVEAGVIEQEEALDDPERNIVTNLMGDEFLTIESLVKIKIKKGNSILVGTDGLFDNLSHDLLSSLLAGGNFDQSFMDLVSICIKQEEGWKKDDDIAFTFVRRIRNKQ